MTATLPLPHRPFPAPAFTPQDTLAYAGKPFMINDRVIRMDSYGRFCLNDLHKEAGGLGTHKPANWARLDSTQGLVEAWKESQCSHLSIEKDVNAGNPALNLAWFAGQDPLIVVQGGRHGGTFAVKELVYDYAMWISPEFKLIVIRVFDRLVERGLLDNGMPDLFGANNAKVQAPLAPVPQAQAQALVIPATNPSLKLAGDLLGLLLATRDSIPSELVARYLEEAKR